MFNERSNKNMKLYVSYLTQGVFYFKLLYTSIGLKNPVSVSVSANTIKFAKTLLQTVIVKSQSYLGQKLVLILKVIVALQIKHTI